MLTDSRRAVRLLVRSLGCAGQFIWLESSERTSIMNSVKLSNVFEVLRESLTKCQAFIRRLIKFTK